MYPGPSGDGAAQQPKAGFWEAFWALQQRGVRWFIAAFVVVVLILQLTPPWLSLWLTDQSGTAHHIAALPIDWNDGTPLDTMVAAADRLKACATRQGHQDQERAAGRDAWFSWLWGRISPTPHAPDALRLRSLPHLLSGHWRREAN